MPPSTTVRRRASWPRQPVSRAQRLPTEPHVSTRWHPFAPIIRGARFVRAYNDIKVAVRSRLLRNRRFGLVSPQRTTLRLDFRRSLRLGTNVLEPPIAPSYHSIRSPSLSKRSNLHYRDSCYP